MTSSKLQEIEQLQLGGASSITRLMELSEDIDEEVRFRAIEGLGFLPVTAESRAAITKALTDSDSLVRAAAVEILGNWSPEHAEHLLVEAIGDTDELVRASAIISLGSAGSKQSIWLLEQKYRTQSCSSAEQLSCVVALYSLGRSRYLTNTLTFLDHECYQIRSAAANLLREFTSAKDIPRVLDKLRSSVSVESTEAARSSMLTAIEDLKSL